jgi:hypothetical protein
LLLPPTQNYLHQILDCSIATTTHYLITQVIAIFRVLHLYPQIQPLDAKKKDLHPENAGEEKFFCVKQLTFTIV